MQKHGTLIVLLMRLQMLMAKIILTPVFRDMPYEIIIKKDVYINYTQKVVIQGDEKIEINAVLNKKR